MSLASAALVRNWRLVVTERPDYHKWVTTACAAGAFAIVSSQQIFGAGGFWGHDAATIASMQQQLSGLSDQVRALASEINSGPRVDQMQSLAHEIGRLDGRLDTYDGRLRQVETNEAAVAATLQGIDAASRASLPKRP